MTIPVVTRLEDWRFALYDLAAGTKTVLNPEMVIDPQVEVIPGVGMERLKSCTFEIPFLATARAAFDFDNLQLLCIDRWGDANLMLWGVVQKPKEGYSQRVKKDSVQVVVASVEELLKCRKAVQYGEGGASAFTSIAYPDDFAKEMVRQCFDGADLDGNSRAWEWGDLVIDADASQCTDTADLIVLSGPEQDDTLYKHLDDLARAYDFDFQLQVAVSAGAFTFTFKTQAPYGGSDLSTGESRVTIKDLYNLVPNATRYRDSTYRATRVYTKGYLLNVEDAAEIAKWGVWEGVASGIKLSDAEIALEKARVKQGAEYGYEATAANGKMALWCSHFKAGDKVNRVNNRLGIAADSEKIAAVTGRFQDKVLAVTIRWGDREPGATDRQSGGAYNPLEEYGATVKVALPVGNTASAGVDPMHEVYGDHIHSLSLTADDSGVMPLTAGGGYIVGADGIETSIVDGKLAVSGAGVGPYLGFLSNTPDVIGHFLYIEGYGTIFGIGGGTGCTTEILADPENYYVTINTVWQRDTVAAPFLASATAGDKLLVNTVTLPDSGTYLYVDGHIRLNARLKSLDERLYLEGAGGIVEVNTPSVDGSLVVSNAAAAAKVGLLSAGVSYISGGDFVITDANDFQMYASAYGADMKFRVDGATGNLWLDNAAVTEFGGYEYTWPLDGAVTGDYLRATVSGNAVTLSWETAVAAAHDLLSAIHGDTLAEAVADGSLIIGNVTPKWSALAISVPAAGLINHLAVANGETRPSWKALFDATVPTTIAPSDAAAAGTAVVAARRDHVHAAPATFPATAHNVLSTTHGDTLADTVIAGDVIIGNATPKWARLAIAVPAANVRNVLGIDNGETLPSWKTALDATAPTTIAPSAAAAAGTSLVFAHRDHTHGAPATFPATAHDILSASHGDALGAAVADGSIIIGNVTPKWSSLAIAVPAANVRNVLGIDNGETRPSWKTALDGTNPATLTAAAAAAPGTSLVFAHRDHVHPITTTTVGAASTIVATDASSYITAVRFAFDASEYLSTSAGTIEYHSSNNHYFYVGASIQVGVEDGYFYPITNNDVQAGTSSKRWSNVYSVLGNYSGQITSSLATGTSPFAVSSTTVCSNLNADYLDGYHAATAATNNTVALRDASAGLTMAALVCSSFRLNSAVNTLYKVCTHSVAVNINGGSYYMMLAT